MLPFARTCDGYALLVLYPLVFYEEETLLNQFVGEYGGLPKDLQSSGTCNVRRIVDVSAVPVVKK